MRMFLFVLLMLTNIAHAHIVQARATNIIGWMYGSTVVPGWHSITIINNTESQQYYTYQFQVCVDKYNCSTLTDYSGHVLLNPHTTIERSAVTTVNVRYQHGTYPIEVTSEVFGETAGKHTAYASLTIQ